MLHTRRFPRAVLTLLLVGTFATAQAQTLTADGPSPVEPSVAAPGDASGSSPQPTVVPVPPPDAAALSSPGPSQLARDRVTPQLVYRFRTGRALHVAGSVIALLGNGLALTSIILNSVYGLDESQNSSLARLGFGMGYAGTGLNASAFILSATGVGLQHSALRVLGRDTGRGMYATGTVFGILGLCGVGTSYFFRFTNYVDKPTTVAFGTSIAAAVLLTVSGILYFRDATRVEAIYRRLTTF